MKCFLLLLLLISSLDILAFNRVASENPISFPKKEMTKGFSLKLSHQMIKTVSHLIIYNKEKKIVFKRASDFPSQGLVDAHVFKLNEKGKLYVFGLWSKGAHGQRVTISELKTGKDVFTKNSSWPLDYKLRGDKIELNFLGDMQESGLPEKKKIVLNQKDLSRS